MCVCNIEGRCLPLNLVPGWFPRGTGVGHRRQRSFQLLCLCGRQCGGIRIWQPLWVTSPPPIAISLLYGKHNFFFFGGEGAGSTKLGTKIMMGFSHEWQYHSFFFKKTVSHLSCGACSSLVPGPGFEPVPWHWKPRVLTTGLPRKFLGNLIPFNRVFLFQCSLESGWLCM